MEISVHRVHSMTSEWQGFYITFFTRTFIQISSLAFGLQLAKIGPSKFTFTQTPLFSQSLIASFVFPKLVNRSILSNPYQQPFNHVLCFPVGSTGSIHAGKENVYFGCSHVTCDVIALSLIWEIFDGMYYLHIESHPLGQSCFAFKFFLVQ